jgi:20S proteasome alpha/beta subunit
MKPPKLPPKFPRLKPQRLWVRRKPVTIAMGFCARDGVVLCADSQYTTLAKAEGPKIFSWTGKHAAVLFAFAGDIANALMLIQDCQGVLSEMINSPPSTKRINHILRTVIRTFQREYIDSRPAQEREDAQVDLILAIAAKDERTKLFYTNKAAMVEFDTYKLAGSGGYLGEYMVQRAYDSQMTTDDAVVLAMHTLAAVKKHDVNCGGPSQFATIRSGLMSGVVPFNVMAADEDALLYEKRSAGLLLDIGDSTMTDGDFAKRVQRFAIDAMAMRDKWKQDGLPYRELLESLNKPVAKVKKSAKS